MGLISYFKTKFGKNIQVRGDISSHLVYVYKPKKNRIWLGSKIIVPPAFAFLFAKNGKVYDFFPSGEYELKGIYLPKCVKKFGLNKENKDGTFPKFFVADAYFVNLALFEYEQWKTFRKIELFDAKYGYYSIGLQGGFAYKVNDPELFLKNLLKVYDFLRQNEAVTILKGFVSEYVVEQIEKNKPDYKSVNLDFLTDNLFEIIGAKLENIGIELAGFKVEKIKFPNWFVKKVEQINIDEEFVLREKELETKQDEQLVPQNQTYFKVATNQIKIEKNDEFVNLDSPIIKPDSKEYVRCMFCGAKNPKDSDKCALCGETLKRKI